MRPIARPICLLNTHDEAERVYKTAHGNPPESNLPLPRPSECGEFFDVNDPVLHLPMNDNEDNPTVHDVRGIYNQTFLATLGDPNTDAHSISGPTTRALLFDGTDDYIHLTPDSHQPFLTANTNFTLAMWWKTTFPREVPNRHFLSNYLATTNGISFEGSDSSYSVILLFRWTGGTHVINYTRMPPAVNTWHHWAITRTSTRIDIYYDGNNVKTDTYAQNNLAIYTQAQPLTIAADYTHVKKFSGNAADFRLYNRALSAAEIAVLATP